MILWMVGVTLGAVAAALLLCLGVALIRGEPWESFGMATLVALATAGAFIWPARRERSSDSRGRVRASASRWRP